MRSPLLCGCYVLVSVHTTAVCRIFAKENRTCAFLQRSCKLLYLPQDTKTVQTTIFSPIMLCSIICSASALLFFPSSYLQCSLNAHLCSSNSHQKSTHATIFVAFGSEYCDPWLDPWLGSSVSHCQTSVSSQPIMTKLCSLL